MLGIISTLGTAIVSGISGWIERKQELKAAEHESRVRMLKSEQDHNHEWEMKQLSGAGWKDDVLFYCWIGFFIWSGFDPDGSRAVVENWSALPDWFLEVSFWIIGGVLGVKKLGDYLPQAMRGIKSALKDG
jgi:hypothetical protein